jgi:hypothetical protein
MEIQQYVPKQANYINISDVLFPGNQGYLSHKLENMIPEKAKQYLQKTPEIKFGDILFIGASSDRVEYGFYIVIDNQEVLALGEHHIFSILNHRNNSLLNQIKKKKIL